MSAASALASRVAALLAHPGVEARLQAAAGAWPLDLAEPPDVAALYAAADGLALPDGTRILPRGDLARATAWLTEERSLDWASDLLVVGEREDLVIVLDLDAAGARAGGGVLEVPTDGLASFQRVARSVVGYLERRLGVAGAEAASPEVRAREAAARRDLPALAEALAEAMYPGAERQVAHAALTLGVLLSERGDEAALDAFARSVEARVAAAARGAAAPERLAAWRACEIAAREAGAEAIAAACAARGRGAGEGRGGA
ncbi:MULTISPECIES: hypothetical protein [Sorangium]|uniref:Uncharacterized protein n=1 Tax=Sorangium cellulosum TaxID=56 RepID=A0A4P2QKF4_SORCE|nr:MULTISPECIES: hypothetical protein [Sorangium]AUX30395.1 hypothetical protein SOCE836_024980 [Sorangium cellulosum]WCQ89789.1 hypothetical protein NQZ70_02481 [Sorangium sp. Soce836]